LRLAKSDGWGVRQLQPFDKTKIRNGGAANYRKFLTVFRRVYPPEMDVSGTAMSSITSLSVVMAVNSSWPAVWVSAT
jgi:hypothetical protein